MYLTLPCHSQPVTKSDKKHFALNRYVNFSNEGIHILWAIHERLESFNSDMNEYIRYNGTTRLSFKLSDIVDNYNYFGVMQGVCSKSYGVTNPQVNIQKLYQETSKESAYIPEKYLTDLNRNRDELMYLIMELLSIGDSLTAYTEYDRYQNDPELSRGFEMLNRCSEIYNEFQAMKNRLSDQVEMAADPSPKELRDLEAIITYSNEIVLGIRNEKGTEIVKNIEALEAAISKAEASKEAQKETLKNLGLYYHKENMGYNHMIKYARQIVRRGREFFESPMPDPVYRAYPQHYYHYNNRLLSLYNHHKYGIIAYYNRFLSFANKTFVKHIEETPLFHVLLPMDDPIAEASPKTSAPLVEDNFDEIPSMEGAASNNLIFLLDVSASMSKPENLPLLKNGLKYLLGLMRPEDQISIVTYSGDTRIVLDATSAADKAKILSAINRLRSSGGTNIKKGIRQAYKVAEENFIPGGNNRIILASDGAFELGSTTTKTVKQNANRNIQLSVFLFGRKEAPRTAEQLQKLANLGGGNYFHITKKNANKSLLKEAKAVRK